jgi:hypothetical protein
MSDKPMSEKQLSFAVSLVIERADLLGIDPTSTSANDFIFAKQSEYTSADASQLISLLLAVPVQKKVDPIQQESLTNAGIANADRVIANKFAKPCLACGHDVDANAGYACQVNTKWFTIHRKGSCIDPVKDGSHTHNRIEQLVNSSVKSLRYLTAEGAEYFFAFKSHTGNNDLDFYGLIKSHRKGGTVWVLKRVLGGALSDSDLSANSPVMSLVEAERVMTLLADLSHEDFAECQMAFANNLGRCFCCGRTLTDERSRQVGMGSVCEEKYGSTALALW